MGHLVRAALSGLSAARHERWEEAVAHLIAARGSAELMGIREPGRRHWLDFALARAYVALGRLDDASEIAVQLEALSGGRRAFLDAIALRIRGLVSLGGGDADTSVVLLQRSASLLAHESFPTEQALTLLELARALQEQRKREPAAAAAAASRELAVASGDAQLQRTIESVTSRRDIPAVDSVLTARERAVALAAARGRTNREIAEENFISVRTVETQLSSAYRKLGLRSRSELAALLRDES